MTAALVLIGVLLVIYAARHDIAARCRHAWGRAGRRRHADRLVLGGFPVLAIQGVMVWAASTAGVAISGPALLAAAVAGLFAAQAVTH